MTKATKNAFYISNLVLNIFDSVYVSYFLDEIVFHIVQFGIHRTFLYHSLTIAEVIIFKILYIYKYSRITAINEYFLTNFMTFFNIIVIFGLTIIRICLEEHLRTRNYVYRFGKLSEVYSKINLP